MPFGFGLGCDCCPTGTGGTLCVSWSACFAYVDMPLTVLFERDGGGSFEHTITGAEDESIAYGTDCIEDPAVGTWTVSIYGECLETVSTIVEVGPGDSPHVLLTLRHKFSSGVTYTDDNGSATCSHGGTAGEGCSWRGAYLYYEPNGIGPITCGEDPFEYTDYVFDGINDVRVEVLVRFLGFWGSVAKFECQKTTSSWSASADNCEDTGLGDTYCKPSNNDLKYPFDVGPYRMWVTSNLDAQDNAGCEEVSFGGSLSAADGFPPVWLEGIDLCPGGGPATCDEDGATITQCIYALEEFDVTYTVTE